jgi:CRP-like cAMP-binding protein
LSYPVILVLSVCAALFVGAWWAPTHRMRHPRRSLQSLLALIRKVPFLRGMPEEQLTHFGNVIRELRVPAGVYVVREHRAGEAMYVVVSGTLHILKRGALDETLLSVAGPGDIIGEMALLTGAKRIASARAITPCILLQFDRDDFHEILGASPEANHAVWDACDEHSIDLVMADLEQTRGVSVAERKRWIAGRTSMLAGLDAFLVPPAGAAFLAVVAGAVTVDGHEREAPCLVPVSAGSAISVLRPGRVCWLGPVSAHSPPTGSARPAA